MKLEIHLKHCNGKNNCRTKLEIEAYFSDMTIDILFESYSMNLFNVKTKSTVIKKFDLHLLKEHTLHSKILFRRSLLQRSADVWFFKNIISGPEYIWFFDQKRDEIYTKIRDKDSLLSISIALDSHYNHYHRTVYGLQNWLIAISGMSRAIMITGLYAS
jgi:hypothetical protein